MANSIDDIIASEGWTRDTVLELLWGFLQERKLTREARNYLDGIARDSRELSAVFAGGR